MKSTFDSQDLPPAEVKRRFRWARRQGNPAWLWPETSVEAWREALWRIELVVRGVLLQRSDPDVLDGDPVAIGLACYTSGMGPVLGWWRERGQLSTSPVIAPLLELHLRHNRMRAARMEAAAIETARALLDKGIAIAVLKGAHTRPAYFPEPGARPASDVDLLVRHEDAAAAEAVLHSVGLINESRGRWESSWRPVSAPSEPRSLRLVHADDPCDGTAQDGHLVLSRVTFRHGADADRPATLQDVSLAIPAGAFVGVVGPSGAGKTSFLDLVAGLLTPQSGRVFANGCELTGEALARHRERLAYVGQDAFLFDDTVRRNLAWSRPDCAEAEMLAALELVGAGALLRRLEHGLDTRIGERGALISAGERQRLAPARALLRRPALLVLDEATNAIDVARERAILGGLARLGPGTTILMVAHRAESLALCDHILAFPGPSLSKVSAPIARVRRPS